MSMISKYLQLVDIPNVDSLKNCTYKLIATVYLFFKTIRVAKQCVKKII